MKNPYKILSLNQDANAAEIARSQIAALRERKYSNKEIIEAQSTLRKPASRLAADFTFPLFDRLEFHFLKSNMKSDSDSIEIINPNKYDSLKNI